MTDRRRRMLMAGAAGVVVIVGSAPPLAAEPAPREKPIAAAAATIGTADHDREIEEILAPLDHKTYSGAFIDDRGRVVIGTTDPAALPDQVRSNPEIIVRTDKYSYLELSATITQVTELLNPIVERTTFGTKLGATPWPYEAWVDAGTNSVVIELQSQAKEFFAQATIALRDSLGGAPVTIRSRATTSPPLVYKDLQRFGDLSRTS